MEEKIKEIKEKWLKSSGITTIDFIIQECEEYGQWVRQQTLEEAIASVNEYKEFVEKSKTENLERENVMLAYDMDSRWVASKHILSNLQALKDKNK